MLFGCCESGIGRRDILCSEAIFSSLIAALLGDAKPARAETISGNVPDGHERLCDGLVRDLNTVNSGNV
jgi:hypothetical protein